MRTTSRSRVTNLGPDSSTFVGRRRELAALARVRERGTTIVTLVGPPGAGKTRLAREFALAVLAGGSSPEGGVWFCALEDARNAGDLTRAVAGTLGIRLMSTDAEGTRRELARALGALRPSLIILDNFEQVVALGRSTVARWARAAPGAFWLVTSRVPLGVESEAVLPVPPLDASDGAALLVDRARLVRPDLAGADDETRAILADVVRRLDGLPHAIELAAARLLVLSPAELRSRLNERFRLLRATSPRASGRASALSESIAWSWELLGQTERRALCQCSVFRGGFTLAAAEAILDLGRDQWPLDAIEALRRWSLLRSDVHPAAPGEMRFAPYESVREWVAAHQTERDGADATAARHAAFYVREGEACAERLDGPDCADAMQWLQREQDNLLQAHRWARTHDASLSARAAAALDPLLADRGPAQTRRQILDAGIDAARRAEDPHLYARLLLVSGQARFYGADSDGAEADFRNALEALAGAPDPVLEANLWRLRGLVAALERHRGDTAREHFARALQAWEGVAGAAPLPAALTHVGLGTLLHRDGRLAEAASELEFAIGLLRAAGAVRHEVVALTLLGMIRREQAMLDDARQHLDEALVRARHVGGRMSEGTILHDIALVEADCGALATATDYCSRAIAVHQEVGNLLWLGYALTLHGALLHAQGDLAGARASNERALRVSGRGADRRGPSANWGYLALLDWEEGYGGRARASVGKAIELSGSQGLLGPLFLAIQAALAAESGDMAAADRALEQANARLSERRESLRLREPVALLGGIVELAKARRAEPPKERAEARARREAVRALCRDRPNRSVNAIIALRFLRSALARDADAQESRSPRALAGPIEVGPEARWLRLPGAERIDLARRRPTRLVLLALTRARLSSPGSGLDVHALLEAAWPGERMLPHAGLARVYTTIRVLRSLGLGESLLTRDDGYLLDSDQPLRYDPDPPAPMPSARTRRAEVPKGRGR